MDLQNYFGRENCILEVTLDIIDTVQFLSASQKSDIIARLARNQGKNIIKDFVQIFFRSVFIYHLYILPFIEVMF